MFSEENPTTSTVILTSPAAAGGGVAAPPVVIQQQQLSPPPVFGLAPVAMTCPHCHAFYYCHFRFLLVSAPEWDSWPSYSVFYWHLLGKLLLLPQYMRHDHNDNTLCTFATGV